jgi:CRP/FNR family transcriptional regulator, dissimilatory nitrate respiration regulator
LECSCSSRLDRGGLPGRGPVPTFTTCGHLRVLVGLLDDLTLKDMETRLANWLLKHCPRPLPIGPAIVQLDRTKRVLAAEMGTTSETLSRTLAKFRDQKLLRVKGNTITLTKPRELQKLLQQHLGEL